MRGAIGGWLERGALRDVRGARALSRAWGAIAARGLARPVAWPEGSRVRVIAIGGATLGGSCKTPLAIAVARLLAEGGAEVALVGHAHHARPRRARVVSPHDAVGEVGDEALACARALVSTRASVIVAPSRQAAVDLAIARGTAVVVLDGALQTSPRRAAWSLLAADAREPWGAAAAPPCGDLRAPVAALLRTCDQLVAVADELDPTVKRADARVSSRGVCFPSGDRAAWDALQGARVGLVTALARPARVLEHLARRGVRPDVVLTCPDHGPVPAPRAMMRHRVDLWLATPKCAASVGAAARDLPLAEIDHRVHLSPELAQTLRHVLGGDCARA